MAGCSMAGWSKYASFCRTIFSFHGRAPRRLLFHVLHTNPSFNIVPPHFAERL